jgi:hypothetical protein
LARRDATQVSLGSQSLVGDDEVAVESVMSLDVPEEIPHRVGRTFDGESKPDSGAVVVDDDGHEAEFVGPKATGSH